MEAETYRKDIKNIEVFGSHCGMGANATILLTVANALSANLETKTKITPQTKFQLGELSKQFTTLAILLLEEQGKLSFAPNY